MSGKIIVLIVAIGCYSLTSEALVVISVLMADTVVKKRRLGVFKAWAMSVRRLRRSVVVMRFSTSVMSAWCCEVMGLLTLCSVRTVVVMQSRVVRAMSMLPTGVSAV